MRDNKRQPLDDATRAALQEVVAALGVPRAMSVLVLARATLERARLGATLDRSTRERIAVALEKLKAAPRVGDGRTRYGDGTRYL